MKNKSRSALVIVPVLVLSMMFLISGCRDNASADPLPTESSVAEETGPGLRSDIQTILVMGLDNLERPEELKGYVNDMQCDFLLLLVIDETDRTIQALHINRDTMTEVIRLGAFGGTAARYTAQIALAHAFGSGGSDSCLNAVKAVSGLLGGIRIDHYMSFTMDSVALINDLVGGVTVRIEDDFSEVDPSLVMGQEITLMGEQALHFVRYRHHVADGTNLNRMNRQRTYMYGLYEKLMEGMQADEDFAKRIVLKLSDSFMTDCSVYQLDALSRLIAACTMEPFVTIEGESRLGDEFMEFYPDTDSLQRVIRELFYENNLQQ